MNRMSNGVFGARMCNEQSDGFSRKLAAASVSRVIQPTFLAICLFATSSLPSAAAIQVDGTTTYEVFSRGTRTLLVEEHFSATVEGGKWIVKTELIATQPTLSRPELFCPPAQQAGSDGEDVYYLKEMPTGTNRSLVGWVEPGVVPSLEQSPTVCLIWLAYCSGEYLARSERRELKPVWVVQPDQNRQNKCSMPVSIQQDLAGSEYLDRIHFIADGRVDLCNPSRELGNMRAAPWNEGFTQAVYRVESKTLASPEANIPNDFTFELFTPVYKSDPPRLGVFARIHGVATKVSKNAQLESWLPHLPKDAKVPVQDYRFTDKVTNWQTVAYSVTNRWAERTNSNVTSAVKIHTESRPPSRPKSKTELAVVRLIIAVSLLLPLVVAAGWWIKTRTAKPNERKP